MIPEKCPHSVPIKDRIKKAVEVIREVIGDFQPEIAIICGSGLGKMAEHEITVKGHEGQFVFGTLLDKPVVIMQGRIHPYEGITPSICSLPVWIMRELGAQLLIVTAATGSLNPDYNVGDIMIIKDHFNSAGAFGLLSPLIGPNDDSVGARFPSLVGMYDEALRGIYHECAVEIGLKDIIRSGVYFYACGPVYETIAEAKVFRMLGGDVCGMSVVHETTIGRYLGMDVLGLALVTNKVCTDYDNIQHPNHKDVLEISQKRSADMIDSLLKFIARWKDVKKQVDVKDQ